MVSGLSMVLFSRLRVEFRPNRKPIASCLVLG
jgi:hypothetical protein